MATMTVTATPMSGPREHERTHRDERGYIQTRAAKSARNVAWTAAGLTADWLTLDVEGPDTKYNQGGLVLQQHTPNISSILSRLSMNGTVRAHS